MTQFRYGNVWEEQQHKNSLILVTTNSFIKRNGCLTMGAGSAKQCRDKFPNIDLILGTQIKHLSIYGLIVSSDWTSFNVGFFQTKTDWKLNSDLKLIKYSFECLNKWMDNHNGVPVHLVYPGINNGCLKEEDVFPIIPQLENLNIWKLK